MAEFEISSRTLGRGEQIEVRPIYYDSAHPRRFDIAIDIFWGSGRFGSSIKQPPGPATLLNAASSTLGVRELELRLLVSSIIEAFQTAVEFALCINRVATQYCKVNFAVAYMAGRQKSVQRSRLTNSGLEALPSWQLHPLTSPLLQLIGSIALGIVVWVVYSRAADGPFIFDDVGSVLGNHSIVRLSPLVGDREQPGPLNPRKGLPTAGRPLVNFSLAVNYHFCQLDPTEYRVFNILIHISSAIVLAAIVRRTLRLPRFERFGIADEALSWAIALVWALHPLQTETVVYITQRTELLMGFFYLMTLYCSLSYWSSTSRRCRIGWLAAASIACLLGMACKEVMATAPLMVLLYDRTFLRSSFREALQKSSPLYVGLALGWGLLLYLNCDGPRDISAGFNSGVPPGHWWLTQAQVLVLYLKLAIFPWPLVVHYGMPYLTTIVDAWYWLLPVVLLMAATLILLLRRNALGFLGAWCFVILAPTLLVPIVTEVAAERRMYLPLAALVTLAVFGGYWLARRARALSLFGERGTKAETSQIAIVFLAAIGLAIIYSFIDVRRLAAYRDNLTLWSDALLYQPNDYLIHNNLGLALFKAGETQKAIDQYQQALRLNPDDPEACNNLGVALLQLGQTREAIDHLNQALRLNPNYVEATNNIGNALVQQGQPLEATEFYLRALRLAPDYADAHSNLANAFAQTGQAKQAIEHYEQALRLNPKSAIVYHNFATLLAQTGQLQGAIDNYQRALELGNLADTHNSLATILVRVGRFQEAIEHYAEALRINPAYPIAHNNLGSVLLKLGQSEQAFEHFQQAVWLEPDYEDAWTNLVRSLPTLERTSQSIAAAKEALAMAKLHRPDAAKQIEAWLSADQPMLNPDPQ